MDGALARSHIFSAPTHILLVLPFLHLLTSTCFHSPELCRDRTFHTVPWSVSLGVLGVEYVLG